MTSKWPPDNWDFSMPPYELDKWDERFLRLAKEVSLWSKDPSTKVGAVLVRERKIIGTGYNGFPKKLNDDPKLYEDREQKLSRIIHGEMNAIIQAGKATEGCTLYTVPFMPCDRCMVHMVQSGVVRIVAPLAYGDKAERWKEAFDKTRAYAKEAGVELVEAEYWP